MSGKSPLFRIGMTCAAIIIGCAIVGSQLASTGNLSQVVSSVADEDEDAVEGGGYAGSSYDPDHVGGDSEDYAEEPDEEPDDYAYEDDDATEGESGDLAEEGAEDDGGGFAVVRRKP